MMIFRRIEARIVFLLVLLGAAGGALAERPVDERPFHALDGPLAPGASVTLAPVTLDDGTDVVLELARVEPFSKDAQVVVHGPDGDSLAPLPSDTWFTGRVAGDPESLVMLARGRSLRGLIVTGDRAAVIGPKGDAYAEKPTPAFVRALSPDDDAPDAMRNFTCGTESLPAHALPRSPLASTRRPLSTVMYYAGIAIETDYELYAKKGSVAALTQYVGDLFAAVSAVYQRDLLVTLQVNYLSVWTTASDPWVATDSLSALYEFGDYWHANHAALARTTAHFMSGRGTGGGIAWVGTICDADFYTGSDYGGGYGFTGSLSGTSPSNISTTYWDFMAVAHEIGHNFGSPHTHCYGFGSYASYPPIDQCYASETGCYSGPTSVPAVKGTIMSYCHLIAPGYYSNIKMFFGVPGEPSQSVLTLMRGTFIESASCLGTTPSGMHVSGISPPIGSTAGGTPITISGAGFVAPVTVKFRGVLATSVVVASATTITAATPAGSAGTADVSVVQGSQGSMLAGGYTYTSTPPPPSVSAIAPGFGPAAGGTAVTITGANFVNGATVSIGGVAATGVVFVNSGRLTAVTPAHAAGAMDVVVKNPDTQTGTLPGAFTYSSAPPPKTPGDYDGDGKADITVFRPSTGTWWTQKSSDGTAVARQLGNSTDIPVSGDYDGDGKADVAVFRPSTGTWWIQKSSSGTVVAQPWGISTDIPVPGDYDGDGKTDVAVYRPSTGTWWILRSSDGAVMARTFGVSTDIPVPGDYDGDGKTDVAIYRPSTGTWWILRSSDGTAVARPWGLSTDIPVAADFDGDHKTDISVYRPSTGTWWILRSSDGAVVAQPWGMSTDVPVPGDYDGDGKMDVAVFRPSTGAWWILKSTDGTSVSRQWGVSTDEPVVGSPR